MSLQQIVDGSPAIPLASIGADVALARELQILLGELGLLDPPADGRFGPVSQWALGQFLRRVALETQTQLDARAARALLSARPSALFPVRTPKTFAGRLVKALRAQQCWLARHPGCINIVYVEGMDIDGKPNADAPGEFNDLRLVLRFTRTGNPLVVAKWEATTEPGRFFTVGPQTHPLGAARIAFGQYKSWSVGTHRAGTPGGHEALVQTMPIDIYRDLNADYERSGDRQYSGLFGINQHWGFDLPKTDIGKASAGCLVGRTKAGHREFMALCKADPRFLANNGYRFMTAVLPAAALSRKG